MMLRKLRSDLGENINNVRVDPDLTKYTSIDTRPDASSVIITKENCNSEKIKSYIKLIRPVNALMMGLAVVVGEVAILGDLPHIIKIVFGFFVSFFLTSAAMVINDIVDVDVDRINAPERPIPSGSVSIKSAKLYAAILALAGILSAVPLSAYGVPLALMTFLISLAYNLRGKKAGFIGNMMVAYCVAVPFLFGGLAVAETIDIKIAVFFLLAFLATTGREVVKGIADMDGDRTKGIATIALSCGPKRAALVAAILYLSAVALTPIPTVFGILGLWYTIIVVVVDVGFVYSSVVILRKQDRRTAIRVKGQTMIWMLLALLAFLFGGMFA
ncbi:MAG: UbiA family prenyltransferase [Candidatus Methanomethyliaceae archaeon]